MFFLLVMGMPLFFVSGIFWPVESMPGPLRGLALLIPSSSAIVAFVRVDQMGADLSAVAGTVRLQLVLAAGYACVTILLERRRAAR